MNARGQDSIVEASFERLDAAAFTDIYRPVTPPVVTKEEDVEEDIDLVLSPGTEDNNNRVEEDIVADLLSIGQQSEPVPEVDDGDQSPFRSGPNRMKEPIATARRSRPGTFVFLNAIR